MVDFGKMTDEEVFFEFREWITRGRNSNHPEGLVGDDRKRFKSVCAEMRKRGLMPERYNKKPA